MWLHVESELFTIKTFFKVYGHHLSTAKNAVNLLSKSSVRFEPWTPCLLASALDLVDCEFQPTVLNDEEITANNKHSWGRRHLFVIASGQSQLLTAMYLHLCIFSKHKKKSFYLSVTVVIVDLPSLPADGTPNLDVSQPRVRWSEQAKTLFNTSYSVMKAFIKDCTVMTSFPNSSNGEVQLY